ncbi:MAG: hypothetical protein GY798_18490 [Hyphomicrobiales bacterium]|nr:hypothetical protein [Hyphomicrobiales bacterium]
MAMMSRWILSAATRLVKDPRVRDKAAEIYQSEVKPRAAETWQKTRPKLEATRDELAEMAKKTDARKNPGAFAAAVKKRYIDGKDNG